MKLTEGIIRDLLVFMEQNMPEKLSVLKREYDADYQDGIALPVPAVYAYGRRTMNEKRYPRVEVLGQGGELTRAFSEDMVDADHEVSIRVVVKGPDTDVLRRQVYRYQRAVFELMRERFFNTTADDYFTTGFPSFEFDDQPIDMLMNAGDYFDSVTWTLTFNKDERD